MFITIANVIRETWIVIAVIMVAAILSLRAKKDPAVFPTSTTAELKGLAILSVILSHIGYFLATDHRFLVPLSNYAGVGVDLFLILSGYGLVASALRRPLSIKEFYKKRLSKIYIPIVIFLGLILIIDFTLLHRTYPLKTNIENLLGYFPHADLYNDVDSPLWFITPLLFYYLAFPLLFRRSRPLLSAIAVGIISWFATQGNLLENITPVYLYRSHSLGFPLGMALGTFFNQPSSFIKKATAKITHALNDKIIKESLRWIVTAILLGVFLYFSKHAAIGKGWKIEQLVSLIISLSIIIIFIIKKFEFRLLTLFGIFSFEAYLFHWPLVYRYDFLYKYLPASVATLLYLIILVALGFVFQKCLDIFIQKIAPKKL